jgi:23S rRNA (cytosine1962-C5)-methyltransferase
MAEPTGHDDAAYELLDVGEGRRLERFGSVIVDRPAPGAEDARCDAAAWSATGLSFDASTGWRAIPGHRVAPWTLRLGPCVMELRPTRAGGLGLYPDHLTMLPWLVGRVTARLARARDPEHDAGADPRGPGVLNLYASTGLATLTLAAAGASIVHVDASRPTVAWARANAVASRLHERPIRWIVDDALGFVRREGRRQRRYDGIVLDPPSYGHGPAGLGRRVESALDDLLGGVAAILSADGFVLLTTHTPGLDPARLGEHLGRVFGARASVETGPLEIVARSGARLRSGAFARIDAADAAGPAG